MGCFGSSLNNQDRTVKQIRKPKPWKFPRPVTWSQLVQMRDEFWDTAPHHGGKKEIWDAIHAAAEADIELAQAIVDSAGVIVHKPDMTVCYDEGGVTFTHLFSFHSPRLRAREPRIRCIVGLFYYTTQRASDSISKHHELELFV